jgi:hypothetical protein
MFYLCDFDGGIGGFFVTYDFIFGKHVSFKITPRWFFLILKNISTDTQNKNQHKIHVEIISLVINI